MGVGETEMKIVCDGFTKPNTNDDDDDGWKQVSFILNFLNNVIVYTFMRCVFIIKTDRL